MKQLITATFSIFLSINAFSQREDNLQRNNQDSSIIIFCRGFNPLISLMPSTIYASDKLHPNLWYFGCASGKLATGEYTFYCQELFSQKLKVNIEANQIYVVRLRVVGLLFTIVSKPYLLTPEQTERYLKRKRVKKELSKHDS